jgi:hypothetical protein
VTWLLVTVLEISVVMAFGFVLGRVWPLVELRSVWMADYEAEMGDFTPPLIGRIPTSCATATGERLYYPRPLNGGSGEVAIATVSKEAAPGVHPV